MCAVNTGFIFLFLRYLVEFSAAELQMMKNLTFIPNPDDIFPDSYITFRDVLSQLNSKQLIDDKAVITKIFSLLDERMSGVISAENLSGFIGAVKNYGIDSRVMSDVSAHTSFRKVIRDNNIEGHLSLDGSKDMIADLRGVQPEDIRDTDLGVEYLINSTERQLERLLTNCPEAAWKTLQQFHRFELMIVYIENQLSPKEIDLGYCDFDLFHSSFLENGIGPEDGITETILKVGLDTVGIDPSQAFSWMLAFNLLADPFSNADEIQKLDVTRTSKESKKLDRVVKLDEWRSKYEADAQLAAKLMDTSALEEEKRALENRLKEQERALELRDQQRAQQENQAQSLIDSLQKKLGAIQKERKGDMAQNEADKEARGEKEAELTDRIAQMQGILGQIAESKNKQKAAMLLIKNGNMTQEEMEEHDRQYNEELMTLQNKLNAELENKDRQLANQRKAQKALAIVAENNKKLLEQADEAVAKALQKQFRLEAKQSSIRQSARSSARKQKKQKRSRRRDQYDDEYGMPQSEYYNEGHHDALTPESLSMHRRGISTEEYTSRGTARKRTVTNIRRDEGVKLRDGRKGTVKWEGRVDEEIGFVLGVDIYLGEGDHDGIHIIQDGEKDPVRKFFFRCRQGQGAWVKHYDVTHVYRKRESDGKEEKVRYTPDESVIRASRGPSAPPVDDDEALMNNAMRGLKYAQVKHMGMAERRKEIVKTKSGRFGEVVDKAFDETGTHYALQLQGGEMAFRRENSVQETDLTDLEVWE